MLSNACKFLSKIPVFMWVVEISLKFARSSGLLIENLKPGSGYLHEIISRESPICFCQLHAAIR
jgi:hypothetical protein